MFKKKKRRVCPPKNLTTGATERKDKSARRHNLV